MLLPGAGGGDFFTAAGAGGGAFFAAAATATGAEAEAEATGRVAVDAVGDAAVEAEVDSVVDVTAERRRRSVWIDEACSNSSLPFSRPASDPLY